MTIPNFTRRPPVWLDRMQAGLYQDSSTRPLGVSSVAISLGAAPSFTSSSTASARSTRSTLSGFGCSALSATNWQPSGVSPAGDRSHPNLTLDIIHPAFEIRNCVHDMVEHRGTDHSRTLFTTRRPLTFT